MTAPPYVEDLGFAQQCTRSPGLISGALTCAFALRISDPAALQATCDKYLNGPAGGAVRYTVLGELVMVSFMHADRLTCAVEQIGWQPDGECAFWVPLIARGPAGMLDRLVFWMPYVVISVAQGMTTGREIWGFRKEIGTVSLPKLTQPQLRFETTATVFDPLDNALPARIEPLVSVAGPGHAGPLEKAWDDVSGLMRGVANLWKGAGGSLWLDGGLILSTLETLLKGEVPLVNLKQFRDAADNTKACYQGLIEGPCQITALRGAGLFPRGFSATIPNWASHRIAASLGLPGTATIPVEFGMWIDMDFSALPGREVWRA